MGIEGFCCDDLVDRKNEDLTREEVVWLAVIYQTMFDTLQSVKKGKDVGRMNYWKFVEWVNSGSFKIVCSCAGVDFLWGKKSIIVQMDRMLCELGLDEDMIAIVKSSKNAGLTSEENKLIKKAIMRPKSKSRGS